MATCAAIPTQGDKVFLETHGRVRVSAQPANLVNFDNFTSISSHGYVKLNVLGCDIFLSDHIESKYNCDFEKVCL